MMISAVIALRIQEKKTDHMQSFEFLFKGRNWQGDPLWEGIEIVTGTSPFLGAQRYYFIKQGFPLRPARLATHRSYVASSRQ